MISAMRCTRRDVLLSALTLPLAALCGDAPHGEARPANTGTRPDRGLTIETVNEKPGWVVRVDVDRADRIYRPGDYVEVEVVSEKAGYLYLFNSDAGNDV